MENGKFPGVEVAGARTATVLTVATCCVGADCTKTLSGCLSSYCSWLERFVSQEAN